MAEFPDFARIIRQKTFAFYFNQIYRPLMRYKNMDIDAYERRSDYL